MRERVSGAMFKFADNIIDLDSASLHRTVRVHNEISQNALFPIGPLPLEDFGQLFGGIAASPWPDAQWTILFERLGLAIEACRELGQAIPRAALVTETLGFLRRNLDLARKAA